jgi:hypothetical protein
MDRTKVGASSSVTEEEKSCRDQLVIWWIIRWHNGVTCGNKAVEIREGRVSDETSCGSRVDDWIITAGRCALRCFARKEGKPLLTRKEAPESISYMRQPQHRI